MGEKLKGSEDMNISSKRHASIGFKVSVFFIAALGVIGFAGFLAGFVCSITADADDPKVSTRARFPLGDPDALAVDSVGNIYCVSGFYCRIQAYSPQGEFIRGWFIPISRGSSMMVIDAEDKIHVGTSISDKHYVYSSEGELLNTAGDMNVFKDIENEPAVDNEGNIYRIQYGIIMPRITKTDAKGEKTVIVSDSFFLWFVNGPLPVWLWIVVAILLGRGLNLLRKRNLI